MNRVFQMQNPLILEKCPQGTASAEKKKAAFEEASSSIENDESIGFIHTTYLTSKQKNLDVFCYVFFFSSFCCLKDFFFFFLSFLHIKKEEKSSSIFAQIAHCNNWVVVLLFCWSCWSRLAHTMSREPLKDATVHRILLLSRVTE